MNYGNSYNANPYLGNTSYPTNAYNGANNSYTQAANMLAQQQFPGQGMPSAVSQQDATNYVSKEDYDKLLQEKRKLQEQLENEMAQRVDIEFFKKEQEMIRLPEGQRLMQELEYQKNQFFEAFWRTSESGKNAMKKYRDSMGVLYDRYQTGEVMMPAQQKRNDAPIETSPQIEGEQVF